MSELTKAMYQVHKELNKIEIKTDSEVNTGRYRYKFLSHKGLLSIIRPVLDKYGLYLDQGLTVIDGKDVEQLKIVHGETGESTDAQCIINNTRDVEKSVTINATNNTSEENARDLQALISNLREDYGTWGAELSYKRRHLLLSKLGLHPDDDTSEEDQQPITTKYTSQKDTQGNTPSTKVQADIPMPNHGKRCINDKQAGLFRYKVYGKPKFKQKIIDEYGHENNIPASEFSKILEDIEKYDPNKTEDISKPNPLPF